MDGHDYVSLAKKYKFLGCILVSTGNVISWFAPVTCVNSYVYGAGPVPGVEEDAQIKELMQRAAKAKRALVFDTAADGSCQFDAIAIGLNQLQNMGNYSAVTVKAEIVKYIQENAEDFASPEVANLEKYLNQVLNNNEWGNQITLQAAADLYQVTIVVLASRPNYANLVLYPRNGITTGRITVGHYFELHYFGTKALEAKDAPIADLTHQELGQRILTALKKDKKFEDREAAKSLSKLFSHLRLRGGENASSEAYNAPTIQGYVGSRFHFAGLLVESSLTKITQLIKDNMPHSSTLANRNKPRKLASSTILNLWNAFVKEKNMEVIDIGSACLPQIYGLVRWNRKNSEVTTFFNVRAFDRSEDWRFAFNACLGEMWKQSYNIRATLMVKDVILDPKVAPSSTIKSKKLIISSFCVSENYASGQIVPAILMAAQTCQVGSVAYFQDRDIKGYIPIIKALKQEGFIVIYEYRRTMGSTASHVRKEYGTEAQRPSCPEFEDKALYIVCLIKIL